MTPRAPILTPSTPFPANMDTPKSRSMMQIPAILVPTTRIRAALCRGDRSRGDLCNALASNHDAPVISDSRTKPAGICGSSAPAVALGKRLLAFPRKRNLGELEIELGQERRRGYRGDQNHPPRAARHEDAGCSARNSPGLRGDANLFADLRICREISLQHWRPRQGRRCADRHVDS